MRWKSFIILLIPLVLWIPSEIPKRKPVVGVWIGQLILLWMEQEGIFESCPGGLVCVEGGGEGCDALVVSAALSDKRADHLGAVQGQEEFFKSCLWGRAWSFNAQLQP